MMDNNEEYLEIVAILSEIFGRNRSHYPYKGQISFDCPVCSYEIKGLDKGDGKGNLEINYKQQVFKCWSCSETHRTYGNLGYLIKKNGSLKQLKRYELLIPDVEGSGGFEKPKLSVKLPKEFIKLLEVSDGFKKTHYYKQAMNYLRSRNIDDEKIKKFNIGACFDGDYSNRIIIPSYDSEGSLNYFVGRSYDRNSKRKYMNPEVEKKHLIWNEHLIDWEKDVYLVEGAFDSIFLENSIPMLGKSMGEELYKLIYENAKKVIIILDGDAYHDSEKLYKKLNGGRLFGKVWIVKLPIDKDIADLQGNINEFKKIQLT